MTYRHAILLALTVLAGPAGAHHSTLGFFDPDQTIEMEGVLTEISWANPHVRFDVDVTNEAGAIESWHVETSALSVLRSRGLHQDFMQPGDRIRISGAPSRRGEMEINGRTVLLADGTEVIMALSGRPYFTDPATGNLLSPVFSPDVETQARLNADGIFRVWSTVLGDPDSFPMFKGGYPLTEEAAAIKAAWNPIAEDLLRCWEKGMPMLMITPIPIEFVRDGENIRIRIEEDDVERLIHMTPTMENVSGESTYLGFSTGRWEGDTLVVRTTDISAPEFDDRGTPQSPEIALEERFSVAEGGNRLNYRLSVSDPATFTRDFELTRYWVWRPELVVQPWSCGEQQ